MIGIEIAVLRSKVNTLEKRIEELEAFVKILKQQGEVKSGYECDPDFLVPSEGFMRGEEKND